MSACHRSLQSLCFFLLGVFLQQLVQDNSLRFQLTSRYINLATTRHRRGGAVVQKHFWLYVTLMPSTFSTRQHELYISVLPLQYQGHPSEMFGSTFLGLLCLFPQLINSQPFPGRCGLFFYLATLTSWRLAHTLAGFLRAWMHFFIIIVRVARNMPTNDLRIRHICHMAVPY